MRTTLTKSFWRLFNLCTDTDKLHLSAIKQKELHQVVYQRVIGQLQSRCLQNLPFGDVYSYVSDKIIAIQREKAQYENIKQQFRTGTPRATYGDRYHRLSSAEQADKQQHLKNIHSTGTFNIDPEGARSAALEALKPKSTDKSNVLKRKRDMRPGPTIPAPTAKTYFQKIQKALESDLQTLKFDYCTDTELHFLTIEGPGSKNKVYKVILLKGEERGRCCSCIYGNANENCFHIIRVLKDLDVKIDKKYDTEKREYYGVIDKISYQKAYTDDEFMLLYDKFLARMSLYNDKIPSDAVGSLFYLKRKGPRRGQPPKCKNEACGKKMENGKLVVTCVGIVNLPDKQSTQLVSHMQGAYFCPKVACLTGSTKWYFSKAKFPGHTFVEAGQSLDKLQITKSERQSLMAEGIAFANYSPEEAN